MATLIVRNPTLLDPQLLMRKLVGKKNKHCLCETCEKNVRGGYAPNLEPDPIVSDSDSDSDASSESETESDVEEEPLNLDERRTRRGVYAICAKEDDSDESENENDDDDSELTGVKVENAADCEASSDLTSLASPPRSTPASLTSLPDNGVSTRSSRLASRSGLAAEEESASSSRKNTPFQSIITTRRQASLSQAQSTREASVSTSVTPVRRSTRRAAASISHAPSNTTSTLKGKEKAVVTPASTPGPSRSVKEGDGGKKEEPESRTLRARSGAAAAEVAKEATQKKEPPRGPDGKLLPLCATCSSVLPVISVDQKVVWGLGPESKKGKNKKQDCPR